MFEESYKLPPRRTYDDHNILLVYDSHPMSIWWFSYPPTLKNKIKKQVLEMCKVAKVQPSATTFSSFVPLVKENKKIMDVLHWHVILNDLTNKNMFVVSVIDELLEELAKACWFNCLHLKVGFDLIHLSARETFKTSFQTLYTHIVFLMNLLFTMLIFWSWQKYTGFVVIDKVHFSAF